MSTTNMGIETDYLDRAKNLRATAAEVLDVRVREALISSAERYERMATWLTEPGRQNSARDTGPIKAAMTPRCRRAWFDLLGLRALCGQAE
jgi:hypothetical protein